MALAKDDIAARTREASEQAFRPVEVLESLDRLTFLEEYRFRKPFVLRGGARHLPAFGKWTLEYLESQIGHILINPLMYEEDSRDYSRAQYIEASFSEFCAELRGGNGFTLYWIAGPVSNKLWAGPGKHSTVNPELEVLAQDFAPPTFLKREELIYAQIILGTGKNGTVVHHDFGGEAKCLMQLSGEKHILLVAPQDGEAVGLHSIAEPQNFTLSTRDLRGEGFAELSAAGRIHEATIGPGDAIYWPSFWLHDVVNRGEINLAINTPIDEVPVSPLMLRHLLAMNLRRLKHFDPGFAADSDAVRRAEQEIYGFTDVRTLWDLHRKYTAEDFAP